MPASPEVSVVMSVYNGAGQLEHSINSILNQSHTRFEFIIINDGSTDNSLDILNRFARADNRIILIDQENQGLTRSLITGCRIAKGNYIARQDVGDYSLPPRLEKQAAILNNRLNCAAVFSFFDSIDENNATLFTYRRTNADIKHHLDPENSVLACPSHHGSAMFRRETYHNVGGYRPQFYFAQDLDLWVRMAEAGEIRIVDQVLYRALFSPNSISGSQHRRQKAMHDLITKNAKRRKNAQPEQFKAASQVQTQTNPMLNLLDKSKTLYFMGSCLIDERPKIARSYFRKSLKYNPLNLKAWYKLLFTF